MPGTDHGGILQTFFFCHAQYYISDIILASKSIFSFMASYVFHQLINGAFTESPIFWNVLDCFQFLPFIYNTDYIPTLVSLRNCVV